jgi:hypothetical protein
VVFLNEHFRSALGGLRDILKLDEFLATGENRRL